MIICIGRLKVWVKLRLCRLRVGIVTTVLALQLVRMQLDVHIGNPLLPIGPTVHCRRNMLAPGCLVDTWLTLDTAEILVRQLVNRRLILDFRISLVVRLELMVIMKNAVLQRALGWAAQIAIGLL